MTTNNTSRKPERTERPVEIADEELRGIAAEFPEFADVIAGANFTVEDLRVDGPRDNMRYAWANPKTGADDPWSVEGLKRLGYKASEHTHNSPDCVLMETPKPLYEHRKRLEREQAARNMAQVRRTVKDGDPAKGLEALQVSAPDGKGAGVRGFHGE